MKTFFTIMFLLIAVAAFAQNSDYSSTITGKYGTMTVRKPYKEVYKVVEQMPVFPGGINALVQYFARIPYPKEAWENEITGTVYLQYVIDTAGNVTQPIVLKSSGNDILDNAALVHLRNMPKWQPGRQRGESVLVQMVQPVRFHLN